VQVLPNLAKFCNLWGIFEHGIFEFYTLYFKNCNSRNLYLHRKWLKYKVSGVSPDALAKIGNSKYLKKSFQAHSCFGEIWGISS